MTTTADPITPGTYTLDNAWEEARHRLQLIERCYDPATTRRLRALGVASGWRCLEVGAGGGSIAAFLSRQAGPQGSVTAVDIDTRFVEEIDADNLDVVQADVTTTELPRDAFDLVHCRALLMHLPARERVLDMFVAALRPGGWLLVEEGDSATLPAAGSGVDGGVLRTVLVDGLTPAGVDWTFARRLPELLQQRGMRHVGAESDVQIYEGGSPMAELLRLTVRQARGAGLTGEATDEQLDTWNALIREPGRWFQSFALVSAWGRRHG
ncbi:MAG: class I SAM-dependent methyltransferase [Acidimicrobiia bacterium]